MRSCGLVYERYIDIDWCFRKIYVYTTYDPENFMWSARVVQWAANKNNSGSLFLVWEPKTSPMKPHLTLQNCGLLESLWINLSPPPRPSPFPAPLTSSPPQLFFLVCVTLIAFFFFSSFFFLVYYACLDCQSGRFRQWRELIQSSRRRKANFIDFYSRGDVAYQAVIFYFFETLIKSLDCWLSIRIFK